MELINHRYIYNKIPKEYKKRFHDIFGKLGILPKEKKSNGTLIDMYFVPQEIIEATDHYNCKSVTCFKVLEMIKNHTRQFIEDQNEKIHMERRS